MVDVVLHGPSFSPANPKVTPEAIAAAVNTGLDSRADAAQTAADAAARNAKLASAQQTIDSLTASLASANTSITALQSALTATQARVTVLETATPPPAVPNAVASFSLGATTNTTQVLNWTAPSGGAALTFYDTKYKLAGAATWSSGPSVAVGTLTATVTGLTAGTSYDYSVVTRNAAGPGASSATLTKATTTTFTPSAAWTKIPPATSITMNDGRVVTVVSGVIYITPQGGSTVPMGNTNSVTLVEISDTGVVYQQNSFLDWWYWNPQNEWIATTDPQAQAPTSNAPAIAAGAGFNTLTFGPDIRVGGSNANWFILNGTAVQQPDTAWRLVSADGYGGGFVTALFGSGYLEFTGNLHGGGFYVRFRAKWSGPGGGGTGGWVGLWSNDAESRVAIFQSNTAIHYPPNGPANSNLGFEPDIIEDPGNFADNYGSALHCWYGIWQDQVSDLQATPARKTWPGGSNERTSYHYYGMLLVPAKPGVRGYLAYTYDDVEYQRTSWDYRADRSTLPYPPSITSIGTNSTLLNIGSELDWRHFYWIAGSGSATPVDLLSVEVFQASTAGNLTSGVTAPPASGGPGPGPAFQALTGSFRDMGNGQRCSTGVTLLGNDVPATGMNYVQIKPFVVNGIWRGGASGNYFGPNSAAFIDQGTYLYSPEVPPIYSATGCPDTTTTINHIAGIRIPIGWWTAGTISTAIKWGLFYEPGFDTDVGGQVYAVIVDYKTSRGDTFHVTANMAGRGVFRTTSWGSILDYTGETSGGAAGLGWIAFIGHTITSGQIIADW